MDSTNKTGLGGGPAGRGHARVVSRARARRYARLFLASLAAPLAGCGAVLDPRGPVGEADRLILLDSLAIMLVVVVPTIVLVLAFAWWYRAGNRRARYLPEWAYSGRLEALVWSIPALIVMFLGGIAWIGSHQIDPYRPVQATTAPEEIQVVSLDWKWLFIYPKESLASINDLVVPAGTPLHFSLTSATVMNSFFVPQLGSQIYTMPGMTSQLYLLASEPGEYRGISAQFSGDGFSDMHFSVHAIGPAQFARWVAGARTKTARLDGQSYAALLKPGVELPEAGYGSVAPSFFDTVLHRAGAGPVERAGAAPSGHRER